MRFYKNFKPIVLLISILLINSFYSYSQKNKSHFGFHYNPIIPNRFIGYYEQNFDSLPLFKSVVKQKFGHNFGMVVRHGISKNISIETGINFTNRNYSLNFEVEDSGFYGTNSLNLINYNIPITGLVFIQLSEEMFMNVSTGLNFEFYPSNISTSYVIDINNRFRQEARKTGWLQFAVKSNIGFEHRSKKGIFYFGGTYVLPLKPILSFAMVWDNYNDQIYSIDSIDGTYLSIDIKYFLPSR